MQVFIFISRSSYGVIFNGTLLVGPNFNIPNEIVAGGADKYCTQAQFVIFRYATAELTLVHGKMPPPVL